MIEARRNSCRGCDIERHPARNGDVCFEHEARTLHGFAIAGAKASAPRTPDINKVPMDVDTDQCIADQPAKTRQPAAPRA